jgi:hypothetical protein
MKDKAKALPCSALGEMVYTIEMELIIGVRITIFPLEGDMSVQKNQSLFLILPQLL